MIRTLIDWLKIPESIRIPYFGGVWYRFLSFLDNKMIAREETARYSLNDTDREERVIVSLTSYPARINYVHLAIKSLFAQTYKPDRIILWLAEEQFETKDLPEELLKLQKCGLEIEWIHDIYGHKKYFYPILNQTDREVVITFDDDIIFPKKAIERLMRLHRNFPNCLICERGQTISRNDLLNPGKWNTLSSIGVKVPTYSMNPSPGGGCLIPYGAFYKDAVNEDKIRKLAYKNDDLWYMFMCAQNKTKMIKTRKYHKIFSLIKGSQIEQMAFENVVHNKNIEAMEKLCAEYPEAWRRICTDKD